MTSKAKTAYNSTILDWGLSHAWRRSQMTAAQPVTGVSLVTTATDPSFLKVELKQRQVNALNAWTSADHCGILAMATGTGKTISGLACAASLESLDLIVVGAPTNEIVRQWVEQLSTRTTFRPALTVTGKAEQWMAPLFRKLRLVNHGEFTREKLPIIIVGTYSELSKSRVDNLIADAGGLPLRSLLIADEVHGTGAEVYRRILRSDFRYRLGLSATPIRPYDEEGSNLLLEYFGGVVYEFTLEEAIAAGILSEYDYHVYMARLTADEYFEYRELTGKIGRLLGRNQGADPREGGRSFAKGRSQITQEEAFKQAQRLMIQRAQIVKAAEEKFSSFNQVIRDHPPRRGIIYCADIDQATRISMKLAQQGFRVARYSSLDGDREPILAAFARGELDALVAVKCLDEGVDVPAANLAIILANDSSERQFIQRRGRILRLSPEKSIATVVDFLVVPPLGDYPPELIAPEINRVKYFAHAARNRTSVITKLAPELAPYGLSYSDLW